MSRPSRPSEERGDDGDQERPRRRRRPSDGVGDQERPRRKRRPPQESADQERPRRKRQPPDDEPRQEPADAEPEEDQEPVEPEPAPKRVPVRRLARWAAEQVMEMSGKEAESVTSVRRGDDGWVVGLEVVESRRVPSSTDVMATYEAEMDDEGELLGFRRVARYSRGRGDE